MGRHCELCDTHEADCKDPAVHWPKDAEGQRRARELRKRWREEKLEEKLKKGADAGEAKVVPEAEAALAHLQADSLRASTPEHVFDRTPSPSAEPIRGSGFVLGAATGGGGLEPGIAPLKRRWESVVWRWRAEDAR
jgi:hypothetical protein